MDLLSGKNFRRISPLSLQNNEPVAFARIFARSYALANCYFILFARPEKRHRLLVPRSTTISFQATFGDRFAVKTNGARYVLLCSAIFFAR